MKLQLYKNEYLWSKEGIHVCGQHGFAMRAEEDMEVEIDDEHYDRVLAIVEAERAQNAPAQEVPVEPSQEPSAE